MSRAAPANCNHKKIKQTSLLNYYFCAKVPLTTFYPSALLRRRHHRHPVRLESTARRPVHTAMLSAAHFPGGPRGDADDAVGQLLADPLLPECHQLLRPVA